MSDFVYRTFLMPHLLIKMGALAGTRPADPDFLGNQFMQGEVSTENANQLLAFIHPASVLLNLAGYHVEGAALAAKTSSGSAALYINMAKCEFTTATSSSSEAKTALKKLIDLDFPSGSTACLGLRLAPRAKWWQVSGSSQYYALPVTLRSGQQFDTQKPGWVLLGSTGSLPASPAIHEVSNLLQTPLEQLQEDVADKLAAEWQKTPAQQGGLLQYLNPDNWGDPIAGQPDKLQNQYKVVKNNLHIVYAWLGSLPEQDFREWLQPPSQGTLLESLRQAMGNQLGSNIVTNIKAAAQNVFIGTRAFRQWANYDQFLNEIEQLGNLHFFEALMLLEELTVLDVLGQVRQIEPVVSEVLPFDITGFYEQIPPPETDSEDLYTYDVHTLQINQAGLYAQGFWQEREPIPCGTNPTTGQYAFYHTRICLELPSSGTSPLPNATAFDMQLYYWDVPNLLSEDPYLKLPGDAEKEDYCKHEVIPGEVQITKTSPSEFDSLIPDEDNYFYETPEYGVEMVVDFGDDYIVHFRRVSPLPYLAQPDLIRSPLTKRKDLVLMQRFPLHSADKIRILAAGRYLILNLQQNTAIFTRTGPVRATDRQAVEDIDDAFDAWLSRYVCVTSSQSDPGPYIDVISSVIVHMLVHTRVFDDQGLEVATMLAVFLHQNADHVMMTTRAVLEPALPPVTPEMEEAVQNSTTGWHYYRWKASTMFPAAWGKAVYMAAQTIKIVGEILDDLDSFAPGVSVDFNLALVEIEKLSPLTDANGNAYEGWQQGVPQQYLFIQLGGGAGFTTGLYIDSDSGWQTMAAPENWDSLDFGGQTQTFSASVGNVIDLQPLPFLRLDLNSFLEWVLHHENNLPVRALAFLTGLEQQNIRLGFGFSLTVFIGNILDFELRWPIVSYGFSWIDYSRGICTILEANSLPGLLIPLTGWSSSKSASTLKQWGTTPVEAVEWQAVEQQTTFNTEFEIDVWELSDDMKASIRQSVAEYLASFRNRHTRLTIIGHASPIGSEDYNLWLSKKRAQRVYDYIRSILSDDEYAILPQNTSIEGYGELYAVNWAFYEADSRAPEWQTVTVYLNGQMITRLSERIVGSN